MSNLPKFANVEELLQEELKQSVGGFGNVATNRRPDSPGYGLVLDRSNDLNLASIASVGYALTVFVIGVERKLLSKSEVQEHVKKTLSTLIHKVDHYRGFYAHYANMETGKKRQGVEYSTIDTALLLQGLIVVENYFKDVTITRDVETIMKRVDGNGMSFETATKMSYFYMAYNDDVKGDYVMNQKPGFIWHWSMPAEQLMMYLQAAISDDVSQTKARDLYLGFQRTSLNYEGISYVAPPRGALFLHQFSHAGIDFNAYDDMYGFNWFDNATRATEVAIKFATLNPLKIKGLSQHAGGLSASDGPGGYEVGGQPPFFDGVMDNVKVGLKGTIQPYSMLGSIVYKPLEVKNSIGEVYQRHPQVWGQYGFYEGYNETVSPTWYAESYLGIDKGISTIMIDNYYHKTTGKYYHTSPYINKALEKLGFKKRAANYPA